MVDFGWSHPDTTQLCSPVLPVTGLWHGDILLGGAQPAGTRHLYRSPVQTAFTVVPPRSLDFKGVAKLCIFSTDNGIFRCHNINSHSSCQELHYHSGTFTTYCLGFPEDLLRNRAEEDTRKVEREAYIMLCFLACLSNRSSDSSHPEILLSKTHDFKQKTLSSLGHNSFVIFLKVT